METATVPNNLRVGINRGGLEIVLKINNLGVEIRNHCSYFHTCFHMLRISQKKSKELC